MAKNYLAIYERPGIVRGFAAADDNIIIAYVNFADRVHCVFYTNRFVKI